MIVICITTHKRPVWCLNLLKEIKKESKGLDYQVYVIHDKCDSDYTKVENYCKKNGYNYLRTNRNFGKIDFWKLHNIIYTILDRLEYDYFIQLVDDITIVKDFTRRAIEPLKHFDVCKLSLHWIFYEKNNVIKEINGIEYKAHDWIDCAYSARSDLLKGFRINKPVFNRGKWGGSGVAHAFKLAYSAKTGQTMWGVNHSLWEHLGYIDSVMHDHRRRKAYYDNPRLEKDPLRAYFLPEDRDYIEKKFKKLMNNNPVYNEHRYIHSINEAKHSDKDTGDITR